VLVAIDRIEILRRALVTLAAAKKRDATNALRQGFGQHAQRAIGNLRGSGRLRVGARRNRARGRRCRADRKCSTPLRKAGAKAVVLLDTTR